jgi:HlyD family secretion protein
MSPDKSSLDALRIDHGATPQRKSQAGWLVGLIVLLLAVGGAVAWWFSRAKSSAVVRTVVVQELSSGGQRVLLNAAGYVTARRVATVSSKLSGKVVEVLVEEGKRVEEGQVLARLDSSNAERSLQLAEAQLESAKRALDETRANLEQAEREFQRTQRLASDKIATQADLDRTESETKALKARLSRQAADAEVALRESAVWRQQLDDTIIRAPFAGVVVSKNAQPGEMISPMSAGGGFTRTGICTIVDMASLEIEVDVSESYINRVEAGQPVEATLDSYPEWKIPAKVIAIIPTADRQKATVKVRVGFDALDPRMLPEMGVKVAFRSASATNSSGAQAASTAGRIVLPKAAVRQRDGRVVVWVVREGRVERRAVTLGGTQGDEATISAGLSSGERVVVEGGENLSENATVTEEKR